MSVTIAMMLLLLLLTPLLFYLSLLLIQHLDFRHQAQGQVGLTAEESRLIWRLSSSCLARSQRRQMLNNLNHLSSLLGSLTQIRPTQPSKKALYQSIEKKIHQQCAKLDRVRLSSQQQTYSHTKDLPAGLNIELFFKAGQGNVYNTQVLEQDQHGFIVNYPAYNFGKPPASWRGQPVLISFSHQDAGTYRFASEFDPNYFDRHFTTLRVLHSNSFVLNQKRQKQRHKVHLRAWTDLHPKKSGQQHLVQIQAGGKISLGQHALIPCTITDLSCSGLKLSFQEKIFTPQKLHLSFTLLGQRINLQGRVCSSQYYPEIDRTQVGLSFTHLSPVNNQQICTFLYGPGRRAAKSVPPEPVA